MPPSVDTSAITEKFEEFFNSEPATKKEFAKLKSEWPEKKSFIFSFKSLEKFDPDLADELSEHPDRVLAAAREALAGMAGADLAKKGFDPHIRIEELPDSSLLIQDIGAVHINKLVSFQGAVTKRAEVRPRVKIAVYRCNRCDNIYKIPIEKGTFIPEVCEQCHKRALELDEDASYFVNLQRAEVQELLERVRGGTPAAHIELLLEDDLVNTIIPGDTVDVVGIVRIRQLPKLRGQGKQSHIFAKYVEVLSIRNVQREFEEVELSKEDVKEILSFAKRKDAFEQIVKSISPSIYGYKEVKEALALQLFGGTQDKTLPEGGKLRSDLHILLIGDPGSAKCLADDSQIVLADGSIQPIKAVVEAGLANGSSKTEDGIYARTMNVLMSMRADGKVEPSEAAVVWKLKAPECMYRITTSSGKTLTTTGIHPFFVPRDGAIDSVKAEDLKVGDFIATPRILRISGSKQRFPSFERGKTSANRIKVPEYVDERFAELAGYLIGDGYLRKTETSYEISITTEDEPLLKRFAWLMKDLFGLTCVVSTDRRLKVAKVCSTELGRLLKSMGMVETSWTKRVPIEIQRSENSVVRAFLSAYFDCEGTVRKGTGNITLVSASKELIDQLQILLLRFGILSQVHSTTSHATNTKEKIARLYSRLSISGESARRFFDEIGFSLSRKQALKQNLKSNTNIDVVPGVADVLKGLRRKLGRYQHQCGVSRGTYLHLERGDRHPSRQTLGRIVSEWRRHNGHAETSKVLDRLQMLAESDIFWDKVVRVERIRSTKKWVYDFEVPGKYNFVANGMIAHNTRLLQNMAELAPKSIYVSGKSVTSVGLTASAERDELGEGWTLKAGALVLASGGLGCIDEFSQIEKEEAAALLEVMESQTVSIAKAGIVARFKARTAILAAANPRFGRFDPNQLPVEQFEISPALLSRFDLIFPIKDVLDEEKDRKLAKYMLASHRDAAMKRTPEAEEYKTLSPEFLRKYVAYARKNVKPLLSQEAAARIEDYYTELRRMGESQKSVAITPRQIEGLVRLSEASAKARLSQHVELEDAERAIRLTEFVLRQIAFDRSTGKIDIDIITSGQPRSRAEQYYDIIGIIRDIMKRSETTTRDEIVTEARRLGINETTAHRFIDEMLKKGDLYEPKPGHLKFVQRQE